MAYSQHMRFRQETDQARLAQIGAYYRIDFSKFEKVFVAMGNGPKDPQPPREILVVTGDMWDEYENDAGDPDPENEYENLSCAWIVSAGMVQPVLDGDEYISRLEAESALKTEYSQDAMLLGQLQGDVGRKHSDRIGRAAADIVRRLRSENADGLRLVAIGTLADARRHMIEQYGRYQPAPISGTETEVDPGLRQAAHELRLAMEGAAIDLRDQAARDGKDAPAAPGDFHISADGLVLVRLGEGTVIFAVDPDRYPVMTAAPSAPMPDFWLD